MKIALTNNFFEPMATGSTHFTRELAAQLTRDGHAVQVITATPSGPDPQPSEGGYRVHRVKSWSVNFGRASYNYYIPVATRPSTIRDVNRLLRAFDPDVVHQNGHFFDLSFITGLWSKRRGVPAVLTVHTPLIHLSPGFNRLLKIADTVLVRTALSTYQPHLVYADKRMERYVHSRYPRFASSAIGYPVDPASVRHGNDDIVRLELELHDRPIILSMGHVIPHRNRLLLIEALPLIIDRVPDVAIIVVGGLYDTAFLDLAEALGVRDHIFVVGAVPHDHIKHYLAAAQIETHDLQGYGLGIASLEAMGSGTPVIAVVDPDTFPQALLTDGRDLVIAEASAASVAEKAVTLLVDTTFGEEIAVGGAKYVDEHFSPAVIAKDYERLYDELVSRR